MYCYLKNECDSHVCLGEGSSGVVKLAMDVPTKELVAIKTVRIRLISDLQPVSDQLVGDP